MSIKFDYILLEQCTKDALKKEVEKRLEQGYLFVGGGSASSHQNGITNNQLGVGYLQAMVLYKG